MQVGNVAKLSLTEGPGQSPLEPKLIQVPNYGNSEINFTYADDFMSKYYEGRMRIFKSLPECYAKKYDVSQPNCIYLYVYYSQLLAMKLDKMNYDFINYHELCKIFNCASILINFNNVKRYEGNRTKIFNDLQNVEVNETANLSTKYNDFKVVNHGPIEIIKIINDGENEVCSFYPIITLKGEKLFDNLIQTRTEIVKIYNEQLEVKKFKKYAITDDEIII